MYISKPLPSGQIHMSCQPACISQFVMPPDSPREMTNPQLKRAALVELQLTWLEWARRLQEFPPQHCIRDMDHPNSSTSIADSINATVP